MMIEVVIVDYGMGNTWSVKSALEYLGARAIVTDVPGHISEASHIILPGVGSYRQAMRNIRDRQIDEAINFAIDIKGRKLLGICLGMQLLGSQSTEDGLTRGLGLIPNKVERLNQFSQPNKLKVPHIGFNTVQFSENIGLFDGLPVGADFYFVHSFRMLQEELSGSIGKCSYGDEFLAAFELSNISGTQFHPEKSQTNGLQILRNFLKS